MESLTSYGMVEVAKVTSKGQVTLPASIRRKLGLRKGSRLIFLEEGKEVRLIAGDDLEKRFAVFERRAEERGLSRHEVRALVKEVKERLWKEHHARGG
ncbi:MAG: AbrB/MazE/SpoVT family DNA-binding domain-containing protein [Thermoplasmata archaeon]|jgi:AbrB family looped-hinge helix DNA binding protein